MGSSSRRTHMLLSVLSWYHQYDNIFFNPEAISSQGKIKIKSTFSTVLFEAFQQTAKIYMADWFAFFCSALLQLFYFRFLTLLIFLTSFPLLYFFSLFFKLLLVGIIGVSLFNCSLSLFSSCSPKPSWIQELDTISIITAGILHFIEIHLCQIHSEISCNSTLGRMLRNWRGKVEDNLIVAGKKDVMNRQRGQNSKASCVFFVLCSGEVPACHTTDIRDRIGIYSDRNHPIVQTTKEVSPLPRSFSPALPSQAPFSAAFSLFWAGPCRYPQHRGMLCCSSWQLLS